MAKSNLPKIRTLDNSKVSEDDCEAEDLGMSSDSVDDLADFVLCRRGKDYSSWMKTRLEHRKWRCRLAASVVAECNR